MLTKKKQTVLSLLLVAVAWIVLLAGCSPSGPDALLDGTRLLERGQSSSAIRKLRVATSLMPTNAMAWGYLGLAYQQDGSVSDAVEAYGRALSLSPDLAEVCFNLGCLWMDQGKWAKAREQFASATVLQKNSAIAWHRLGEAQVRLGQSAAAVQSLREALQLDKSSADAWNWMGVAQLQEGRAQDAARSFQAALRLQTNHGPALLNLAILTHKNLGNPEKALGLYRQYLAFLPNAANATQVRQVADQLEAGLRSKSKPVAIAQTPEPTPVRAVEPETNPLTARAVVRAPAKPKSNTTLRPVPPPTQTTTQNIPVEETRSAPVMVEAVQAPPEIAASASNPEPAPSATAVDSTPSPKPGPVADSSDADQSSSKKGFFAKINPLNLFKKKSKQKQPTPLPSRRDVGETNVDSIGTPADQGSRVQTEPPPLQVDVANVAGFRRYPYRFSRSPLQGDSRSAQRAFDKGEKLVKRGKKSEAIQAYRSAVQADPAYFSARFNLGLLYLDARQLPEALVAFEAATRIQPETSPARYNFALALKSAGYPLDSANELSILLSYDPNDSRAHLTFGNLYAQRFADKSKAREHYNRVLELDPNHPQASSIRFWLVQNPL